MSDSDDQPQRLDLTVGKRVSALQYAHLRDETPESRAALAHLRAAVDEEPGIDPGAWELVMQAIPDSYRGHTDAPSDGEWAAHLALTFYAVHQQSRQQPMHVRGVSFGTAVGRLVRNRTPSTKARYDAALAARSFSAQRYHLRGLIGLLRTDEIGLDYGRFAQDLFLLQKPQHRDGVLRRWGRDFFHAYTHAPAIEPDSHAEEPAPAGNQNRT